MNQRKILNKVSEEKFNQEEENATLSYDGKQFLIRIPKVIAEIKKMEKGDQIKFHLKIAEKPTPIEDSELTIEYVRKK
jgi:hypothetical protein